MIQRKDVYIMSMSVKPDYVNPLTLMGKKHNGLTPKTDGTQKSDKSDDVDDLVTKQQTIQNQMLILKSTSDGASVSGETQEILENALKEVSAELKTAKAMEVQDVSDSATALASRKSNFDRYEKSSEQAEAPGMYQLLKDKEDTYKISYLPYQG